MKSLHSIPKEVGQRGKGRHRQKVFWTYETHPDPCNETGSGNTHTFCMRRYLTGHENYTFILSCDCVWCPSHVYVWNGRYTCNACRRDAHFPESERVNYAT